VVMITVWLPFLPPPVDVSLPHADSPGRYSRL